MRTCLMHEESVPFFSVDTRSNLLTSFMESSSSLSKKRLFIFFCKTMHCYEEMDPFLSCVFPWLNLRLSLHSGSTVEEKLNNNHFLSKGCLIYDWDAHRSKIDCYGRVTQPLSTFWAFSTYELSVFCDSWVIYKIHKCYLRLSFVNVRRRPSRVLADSSLCEFLSRWELTSLFIFYVVYI